jgi:hypothetical protein
VYDEQVRSVSCCLNDRVGAVELSVVLLGFWYPVIPGCRGRFVREYNDNPTPANSVIVLLFAVAAMVHRVSLPT